MNEFLKNVWHKFRILPLLILVASLAFVVRIGDAAMEVKQLSNSAQAADTAAEAKTETPTDITKTEPKTDGKDTAKPDDKAMPAVAADAKLAKKTSEKPADKPSGPKTEWKDANDGDLDTSNIRQDVYKDLLQRRQQLDQREKDLTKREALLTATNSEITSKIKELTSLKTELQNLLKKQTDEEGENVTRLVKIYEGMKPKDAARIFNALDMDVLISVISKMTEKKSALIIAAMDADKARTVTLMLSEEKKLPDLNVGNQAGSSDVSAAPEALPALGQERDQSAADAPPPAPAPPKAETAPPA